MAVGTGSETCSLPQPASPTAATAETVSATARRDGRLRRASIFMLRSAPSGVRRTGSR
jgi:hypothetical protein